MGGALSDGFVRAVFDELFDDCQLFEYVGDSDR
jgi:hypothetical protein